MKLLRNKDFHLNIYFVILYLGCMLSTACTTPPLHQIDISNRINQYVEAFNRNDNEIYIQHIPNSSSDTFLINNIPHLDIPDKFIEEIYYFRWWTYRKHIKKTTSGFVITEFLPNVSWAGKFNTISCPAAHHIYEGRWLKNPVYINDYINFWLTEAGNNITRYSFWIADASLAFYALHPSDSIIQSQLPYFIENFEAWEKLRKDPSQDLFWQFDAWDGMEYSASGQILNGGIPIFKMPAIRPSINSYMYGDALAIADLAETISADDVEKKYRNIAVEIKNAVEKKLWNNDLGFFTVLPRDYEDTTALIDVRENIGYTPWYFNLPDDKPKYQSAWNKLMDSTGFLAPFGLTTCEQNHPYFAINYTGADCQWNGPVWPYATTITLKGLSNLLKNYAYKADLTKNNFYKLLLQYAKSHKRVTDAGDTINWIDENINPYTGDWISRTRLKNWENETWSEKKGGVERGKDYNHSGFCDLVISDLLGVNPARDGTLIVNPLVPEDWDWFYLDNVWFQNNEITLVWDKHGRKYKQGKGLSIYVNGKLHTAKNQLQSIKLSFE